jgi:hypothetical protein
LKLGKSTQNRFSGSKMGYFLAAQKNVYGAAKHLLKQHLPVTNDILHLKALRAATEKSFQSQWGRSNALTFLYIGTPHTQKLPGNS